MIIRAEIPLPIQVVIDDVGWWSGENGSARQEPYRTGIARNHAPADYAAVISLGRKLKMRPQAAFILCEWDKHNILRDLPHSTWQGEAWDNRRWIGPWLEEAAEIIRNGSRHMEFTLHGVGHEFWGPDANGDWGFTRAEWHDSEGRMRPRRAVEAHLDYFQMLMQQHNLGAFPTSFVPCAFKHRCTNHEGGIAAILKTVGINFISTPYARMHGEDTLEGVTDYRYFGFDCEVMTVDRRPSFQDWHTIGTPPERELDGPICGLHWPNILHLNPQRNEEIVDAWVNYLKPYDDRVDRMLAPDTSAFAAQLAHHSATRYCLEDGGVTFDFTAFSKLPLPEFPSEFVLKIEAPMPLLFSTQELDVVQVHELSRPTHLLYRITLRPLQNLKTARLQWQRDHSV